MTITKVVGRAVQGMTRPFLCKAGFFDYYVKGAYAGLDSLCCEWVANRLVNCAVPSAPLGLPMFDMGEVPHALIVGSGQSLPSFRWNGCTWMATRVCLCNWT